MKKVIITLSGILFLTFIPIAFLYAQNGDQETKKQKPEMSVKAKCSETPCCPNGVKIAEVKKCDPAKCKAMGCDPAKCKEGKCDPSSCKAVCPMAKGEVKKCPATSCGNMKN